MTAEPSPAVLLCPHKHCRSEQWSDLAQGFPDVEVVLQTVQRFLSSIKNKSMLAVLGSFLPLGKVGKGISGEERVAERNQWDPGTGGPQRGWEIWKESGSVMFSYDGEVGKR